jgi:glycerate 2-kinase
MTAGPVETRNQDTPRSIAKETRAAVFEALGNAVITGPTLTNVNDSRAILIA